MKMQKDAVDSIPLFPLGYVLSVHYSLLVYGKQRNELN